MSRDPYKYFRVEGRELVEALGKGVLEVERRMSAEGVAHLLRLAHTLKGAARVVKLRHLGDLAHGFEGEVAPYRKGDEPLSPERVRRLLQLLDEVAAGLDGLSLPAETDSAPALREPAPAASTSSGWSSAATAPSASRASDGTVAANEDVGMRLAASVARRRSAEGPVRLLRADAAEMDALLENVMEVSVHLGGVRRAAEPLARARQLAARLLGSSRSALAGNDGGARRHGALLAELEDVLGRSHRLLTAALEDTDRELQQVRSAAERLRLLPASAIFDTLDRTSRDAADSLDKKVQLRTTGGDMRLEGQVLASLQGALVQVVRNAVAHGIERPQERLAAGKPALGQVVVEVGRRGMNVAFACRDDGRGLDLEAIRAAAVKRGMAAASAAALKREELIELLLGGGLSTASEVTELSGRGIGIDLIGEAVRQWGGEVTLETTSGKGTTWRLEVPASLSALEVLLVVAGEQTVGIPLAQIRRSVRLAAHAVLRVGDRLSLLLDEQVLPFASLGRLLTNTSRGSHGGAASRAGTKGRQPFAVVVASGGVEVAWGVDRLLGAEEVVIRPLPPLLSADPVVAGASLDADGHPLLVLDPEALVAYAQESRTPAEGLAGAAPRILVIDDSLTTRMLEQSILEAAGYDVDVAISAEEGLIKVRARSYHLILVDVEMPGMDGFAFVSALQADSALRSIPAILVTSRSSAEDRQRGHDVGAAGYVVKSEFDQAELLHRIHGFVARHEAAE